jgi:DNA-3-methyladenine glycosylase I
MTRVTTPARRCFGEGNPLYERYHDTEWGRPVVDDQGIYERICLEAFQTGISWVIVLRKRKALREALAGFAPDLVARYDESDLQRLMTNPAIIRNKAKLDAAVANARATRPTSRRSQRSRPPWRGLCASMAFASSGRRRPMRPCRRSES